MSITWSSDFPGGNGRLLEAHEGGQQVTARFAAEPKNCPQAMWFHFRAGGLRGRRLRVVLANPEQTLGGTDWSANRIVFREPGRPWRRAGEPRRADAPGGRVEWAWDLPAAGESVEAAHCYPYQPEDLAETLAGLADAFEQTRIGVSLAGRTLVRAYTGRAEAARPGVLLTARHHAGETPGSWVLDGLLRHVAAEARLREAATWWAVPFVDLDDVLDGSYGKNPWPWDTNRGYGRGAPRRPESAAVMADARRLAEGSSRLFLADLHAPSHREQSVYVPTRGWSAGSPENPIAAAFAERLHQAVPEEIRSPVAHATPKQTLAPEAGMSARVWAMQVLGGEAITLESSYQGRPGRYYRPADYARIGQALAETIVSWLADG